jgi:hypothetical protein
MRDEVGVDTCGPADWVPDAHFATLPRKPILGEDDDRQTMLARRSARRYASSLATPHTAMPRIASVESGFYRVPQPIVLTDSTHGEIRAFELNTVRVRDADGAETERPSMRFSNVSFPTS